ncbi:EamA family transporter [Paenibacillus sp. LMG 31456]|uniref:EamA family transporter n=1 Tax=Paenibacillus foliorum TaxID=2654974 RepID=A0A972GVN3_9BACL|nr:EamA family transporter [Paenibacillus foliorum]NOU97138.1 EamA family transporter [Paenibacillus foliorum]
MNKFQYIGLIVLTTFLMGIAFPVGKIGMLYAPPFLLMGVRFVLAGGLLAIIVARKPQPRSKKQWVQAAVIGLLQSAGVMGCAYYSMRWITSGESSIITCTNPLLVIVLGALLTRAAYRGRQWLGVAIGFIGVVFTFGLQMDIQPGTFISFAGAVCFASATLLIKRWGSAFDLTVLASYQMLSGGIALLVLSAFTEHPYFIITSTSISVLLALAILCSIVQFSIWFNLLRIGDPAKTSSFLFLVPLFGVLSSWLLLGETVEWYVGVGGAFICVGIFLVNWEGKTVKMVEITKEQPA